MPFDPSLYSPPLRDVARRAVTITASDATTFDSPVVLYVGTTGNVTVKDTSGATVTFASFPAGEILPLYVLAVMATGTTAGNFVGLS